VTFRYRIADRLALLVGFQQAHRRRSFEEEIVRNTNVSVGASYTFLAKTAYPRLPMDFFDNERVSTLDLQSPSLAMFSMG